MFQVAATANGVTYTGTVATPKPTSSSSSGGSQATNTLTGTGVGNYVRVSFGTTTLFAVVCATLGAFSVFI